MNIKATRLWRFLREKFDAESRRLFRNSTWVFIANANKTAVFFIRFIILARGLGVEVFGLLALIIALVSTTLQFCNLNLPTTLIKFGAEFRADGRADKVVAFIKFCLGFTLITGVLSLTIIGFVLGYSYERFIEIPGLTPFIMFYAVGESFLSVNGLSAGILRLHDRFRLNSIINIVADWLELVIVSVVILIAPGLSHVLLALAASMLVRGVIVNTAAFTELGSIYTPFIRETTAILRPERSRIWHFILYNSLGNTLQALARNGDVLLLGLLSSATQVGLYTLAKRLGYFMLRITDPMTNSIYPQLASLVSRGRHREARIMLLKVSLLVLVPVAVISLILFVFGGPLINVVFGIEFNEARHALRILLFAGGLGAVLFWALPVVLSLGMVRLRLLVNLAAISVAAVAGAMLAPHYGAVGIAFARLMIALINKLSFVYVTLRALRALHAGNGL